MLIGFSARSRFAVRLVRRVGRHHAPRTEIARERLSQLRRMWALLVAGGGAGFIGLAFVLTSIHHWLVNPERNVALVLVPIGLTSILIGSALLVVTTAIYILGRNRIAPTAAGLFVRVRTEARTADLTLKRCERQADPACVGARYIGVISLRVPASGDFQ